MGRDDSNRHGGARTTKPYFWCGSCPHWSHLDRSTCYKCGEARPAWATKWHEQRSAGSGQGHGSKDGPTGKGSGKGQAGGGKETSGTAGTSAASQGNAGLVATLRGLEATPEVQALLAKLDPPPAEKQEAAKSKPTERWQQERDAKRALAKKQDQAKRAEALLQKKLEYEKDAVQQREAQQATVLKLREELHGCEQAVRALEGAGGHGGAASDFHRFSTEDLQQSPELRNAVDTFEEMVRQAMWLRDAREDRARQAGTVAVPDFNSVANEDSQHIGNIREFQRQVEVSRKSFVAGWLSVQTRQAEELAQLAAVQHTRCPAAQAVHNAEAAAEEIAGAMAKTGAPTTAGDDEMGGAAADHGAAPATPSDGVAGGATPHGA